MDKVLVICAHPDDETLGPGGTLSLHAIKKDKVSVLIIADGETSRESHSKIEVRQKQAVQACSILGISDVEFLNYPDQKLDSISLLELTKKIKEKILKFNPSLIYTHYWEDLNNDHRRTFEATAVASRPFKNSKIRKILCFETPSSTEWSLANKSFKPNCFVNIEKVINKKLSALKKYKNEIHSFPHPRSIVSIRNRSRYWGSISGLKNAEPFMIFREVIQ